MADLLSLVSSPVPPVEPPDLQRVFALITSAPAGSGASTCVKLIADECTSGSNPEATSLRALLLSATPGGLDDWRDGSGFQPIVFETMAVHPLPSGAQSFDRAAFIEALRRG